MINIITKLNRKVEEAIKQNPQNIGIYNGQMGIAIYYYYLHRITNKEEYRIKADSNLESVLGQIGKISNMSLKNGLLGIALGVDYLLEAGLVSGDANDVLHDIDDVIFKFYHFNEYETRKSEYDHLGLLYYLYRRLSLLDEKSDNFFIFKALIIEKLETYYNSYFKNSLFEPPNYTILYAYPLFLNVLSKIYTLKFYNLRINNILNEVAPYITTVIPSLSAHRLFLLWCISDLNDYIQNNDSLSNYVEYLKENIDSNKIIYNEFGNKNIYFEKGISSLYFIVKSLQKCALRNVTQFDSRFLFDKIKESDAWHYLLSDDLYFKLHSGLISGYQIPALILLENIDSSKTNF